MGGARHVTAVDVSQFAVDTARENAERNGLTDRMDFLCADVFDLLPKLLEEKADYDMIILDPPAFTKSRKTVGGWRRPRPTGRSGRPCARPPCSFLTGQTFSF